MPIWLADVRTLRQHRSEADEPKDGGELAGLPDVDFMMRVEKPRGMPEYYW
jgi:hypothetical protein